MHPNVHNATLSHQNFLLRHSILTPNPILLLCDHLRDKHFKQYSQIQSIHYSPDHKESNYSVKFAPFIIALSIQGQHKTGEKLLLFLLRVMNLSYGHHCSPFQHFYSLKRHHVKTKQKNKKFSNLQFIFSTATFGSVKKKAAPGGRKRISFLKLHLYTFYIQEDIQI